MLFKDHNLGKSLYSLFIGFVSSGTVGLWFTVVLGVETPDAVVGTVIINSAPGTACIATGTPSIIIFLSSVGSFNFVVIIKFIMSICSFMQASFGTSFSNEAT